jgi:uncharacterized protein
MSLSDSIEQDLKSALLQGDTTKASTLRSIKNSMLYFKVNKGSRDQELSDQELLGLLQKEAKKRQESADLYNKVGEKTRADQELSEKAIIEKYLPESLTDDQISQLIDKAVAELDSDQKANLGAIIRRVVELSAGAAQGSDVARLAQERIKRT